MIPPASDISTAISAGIVAVTVRADESVDFLGVSLLASLLRLLALILLFAALWPKDLRLAFVQKGWCPLSTHCGH
jgi:hypothetical protein